MDTDFLQSLENEISGIGADEVWKKQIGNKLIWFSPIASDGQSRVQETMLSEGSGASNILEARKVTLAYAIVGINDKDLRPYRKAGPIFTVKDPRMSEEKHVDLSTYLLYKITDWGVEFMDIAFDIYADLIASYKNKLLKGVEFENVKDPKSELAELEDRAAALRQQLSMPRMVEEVEKNQIQEHPAESVPNTPNVTSDIEAEFNPFSVQEAPKLVVSPSPAINVAIPAPVPQRQSPVAIPNHPPQMAAMESSPSKPFQAIPSVPQEVVEVPKRGQGVVAPPVINPGPTNINPRFHRPQR